MENLKEFINWFNEEINDKDYLVTVKDKEVIVTNTVYKNSYGMVDLFKITKYCLYSKLQSNIFNGKLIIKNI